MLKSREALEEQVRLLEAQIKLEAERRELKENVPHLSKKRYFWQQEYIDSLNRFCAIVAANQIGKSVTNIEKMFIWATEIEKFKLRWARTPKQFWYLYPSQTVALTEFNEKWVPEVLPRGRFKDHPIYGWELEKRKGDLYALRINSGISCYFKTYEQNVQNLQTGSVDAIFCDEELDESLYDELNLRLTANRGYMNMVFTATKGQELWRQMIEENRFPDAHIVKGKHHNYNSVTMYDCLKFPDGSDGHISLDTIEYIKKTSKSKIEVDRRVYGKFVREVGLKFQAFDAKKHYIDREEWWKKTFPNVYAGVDLGKGGGIGHPSAIVFIAVNEKFTKGRVVACWRGDDMVTTASDVLVKFQHMRTELGMKIIQQYYDHSNADFGVIADRSGEPFLKADKSRMHNETIANTLFRNDMIKIYKSDEANKLVNELNQVNETTLKSKAKDDLSDAFLYAIHKIPWDFASAIKKQYVQINKAPDTLVGGLSELYRQKRITPQQVHEELGIHDGDDDFLDPDNWHDFDDTLGFDF